jgi:hypothetical protein
VAAEALPAGVTAEPVTLAGDQSEATITLKAAADAAQGQHGGVRVKLTAADNEKITTSIEIGSLTVP